MNCEVAVVGGGIGGLTVAALLAQRGVDVCLFERASVVGGCAASFDKFGYNFEQGYGLFTGWEPDEIHRRVFSELPVLPPEVRLWEPAYVVRLPDQCEVKLGSEAELFEENLHATFPECAGAAVAFYRKLFPLAAALRHALQSTPDLLTAATATRAYSLLKEGRAAAEILKAGGRSALEYLDGTSLRFRRFIDVQLQTFAQGNSDEVSYLRAVLALSASHAGMFAIRGGGAALANTLADSIKQSGGRIRLDTTVLRLSYASSGAAVGVDLLSGETVITSRAIVSNLTVWDTYGKLVGLSRTPSDIRKQLGELRGWGAYLIYLALDEHAAASLVADHLLTLSDWQEGRSYDPEANQLVFAAAPAWDSRAPQGKRVVTVQAFTDVDDWFTFHKDETELDERDQEMLERCWSRLHTAMPELGSSVEVIETATPQSFYDLTRRKLGMVGGVVPCPEGFWRQQPSYTTSIPNLFIVSDTTYPGGIADLTRSALVLANHLAGK